MQRTGCLATSEPYSYDRTIARCVNRRFYYWPIKFYRVADLHDPFPITAILFLRVIIYFCIYFKYNFLLSTSTQVDFFWSYFYFYLSRFFWIYFYFYSSRKQIYLLQLCVWPGVQRCVAFLQGQGVSQLMMSTVNNCWSSLSI